jgi:hypothetical protein
MEKTGKLEQIIQAKVLIKMLEKINRFKKPNNWIRFPIESTIKQFEKKKRRKLPKYFKKTLIEEFREREW